MSQSAGEARIIAGGVALMVLVRHQLFFPTHLISLKRIAGLDRIGFDEKNGLSIGALVTHHQVESSPIVRQDYPALAECVHHVGNLRVRNMGTVVGDLCQADNHSDPAPLLAVLGAKIKARSTRGERLIPIEEFHVDIYETGLKADEIVTEILIPPPLPGVRTDYLRFSGNSPIDWPILAVAGSLIQEDGHCKDLKISVGSLTAVPLSFDQEAETLEGKRLTPAVIKKFARSCVSKIDPIPDHRGSEWYKKQIAEVYVRRTIESLRK
ncbi:MAG: FAD binding domain-containing protein [Deltaproteobacteria bacterium]|nr:FAD binding domain-containing protein [Deltaproteobacteria bacterium]